MASAVEGLLPGRPVRSPLFPAKGREKLQAVAPPRAHGAPSETRYNRPYLDMSGGARLPSAPVRGVSKSSIAIIPTSFFDGMDGFCEIDPIDHDPLPQLESKSLLRL